VQDAQWHPQDRDGKERTGVAIGSGMSATADLGKAGQIVGAGQTRRCPTPSYHISYFALSAILLQILVLSQTADLFNAGTLL